MRRLLLALSFLSLAPSARAQPAFDYYLFSLSIAPDFCAASKRNASKDECRTLTAADFQQTPLTIHGLWPNRARVSVNQQPHDCDDPPFTLSRDVADALRRWMPAGPGLARYEWRKHGTCSGLTPAVYFTAEIDLAQKANAVIGQAILQQGDTVRIADLQRRVAATDPALAAALIVDCRFVRGGTAVVEEIRLTLDRDLHPIPAASVGLGQNSGCPAGQGRIAVPR